jgi:periplasmic protein TonB
MIAPRIVDEIFAVAPARAPFRQPTAIAAGVGAHVLLVVLAVVTEPSLAAWSAALASRIHDELTRQTLIESPPEPQAPPPDDAPPPAPSPDAVAEPAAARPAPLSPAQAGRIVARESSGPLDLTGTPFTTGDATTYTGGATSSIGTSTTAVDPARVGPPAPPPPPPQVGPDRSRAVALAGKGEWRCPWPRAADADRIDKQVVTVKVVVRADGSVESAAAVSDPGHGFAEAATACALRTRFEPALDREGNPTRGTSPVRVHFSR